MSVRNIYLDHSASTPTDPRVVEAMLPYFSEVYGNALSVHSFGRKAEGAIEEARETVAGILKCKPSEIVFTSGGSESDNLAVRGAAWWTQARTGKRRLITTAAEHDAVRRTVHQLGDVMGFSYTVLPVNRYGIPRAHDFEQACRQDGAVASVVYASNEVGSILPIADLAPIAREHGVLFHTDAVQAVGQLPLDVQALGVDMLSLSAHKFYGPKGIGALYVREGVELESSQTGGSHENGRRAGTHNTPLIVGLAKALEIAYLELDAHTAHYRRMRDLLIEGIKAEVPHIQLTGHPQNRLPSHASFVVEGIESSLLIMHLDINGIAASSGSACKTGSPEPSQTLLAMGYTKREAIGGLRLTVGRQTTTEDVEYTVEVLAKSVEKLYRLQEKV